MISRLETNYILTVCLQKKAKKLIKWAAAFEYEDVRGWYGSAPRGRQSRGNGESVAILGRPI
jgi:hypothetical protein